MLKTVEHLFNLGITPLWLKTKSKMPLNKGWTEAPRGTLAQLVAQYRAGFNLGVRLGNISRVGDGYLAAIDIDVKSADPKHKKEAHDKVKEFIASDDLKRAALTYSGRGNGSAHVWIRTTSPTKAKRLAQSGEDVEVFMPSAGQPTSRDLTQLGEEKVKAGFRLRPAWEISLMGEGQQIVVPPSIHPDTNKPYEWKRELRDTTQLPIIDTSLWNKTVKDDSKTVLQSATIKKFFDAQGPIEVVDEALEDYPDIDSHILAWISGDLRTTSRSEALLFAAEGLVKAGFSRNQVLTFLSEPGTYLGDACYEHRKTDNRLYAMDWLAKYTVDKAFKEHSAVLDFAAEAEISDASPEEKSATAEELIGMNSWRHKLDRNKQGKPNNTLRNVLLILENVESGKHLFTRDLFKNKDTYSTDTPWNGKEGAALQDLDMKQVKRYIAMNFQFEPSRENIEDAVTLIAHDNGFHPLREWLKSLAWDGTPRIDTWIKDYMGGEAPEPYLSTISRRVLVAMVKRIMEPGCKFDQVLVLEGKQGIGKSRTLRALAGGDDYFSDATINMADKDAIVGQFGVWLHELGEMGAVKRSDIELQKEFISRPVDRARLHYQRFLGEFPRQIIFIGTTNSSKYLKDPTGNRRFWPCKVHRSDEAGIKRVREQLFAEAMTYWALGEPIWLDTEELDSIARDVQGERVELDPMFDAISEAIEEQGGLSAITETPPPEGKFHFYDFTMRQLFGEQAEFRSCAPLAGFRVEGNAFNKAGELLRKLGFVLLVKRVGGVVKKVWRPAP